MAAWAGSRIRSYRFHMLRSASRLSRLTATRILPGGVPRLMWSVNSQDGGRSHWEAPVPWRGARSRELERKADGNGDGDDCCMAGRAREFSG